MSALNEDVASNTIGSAPSYGGTKMTSQAQRQFMVWSGTIVLVIGTIT